MLSGDKLSGLCEELKMSVDNLAGHVARGGLSRKDAASAIRNWKRRLYKPLPTATDVEHLAGGLGVEAVEISEWRVSYRYAPTAPRKARLVADMIAGLPAQKALDVLKFEHKRAARMIEKLLQSAIANADEAEADVERLIVSEARVDGAGRRLGTKGWIAKDRGRAHPIRKEASHLHVTVTEE